MKYICHLSGECDEGVDLPEELPGLLDGRLGRGNLVASDRDLSSSQSWMSELATAQSSLKLHWEP